MRYCDLHCDALTKERDFQVTKENLTAGGCYLQCFAAFISVRKDRYDSALTLCDRFDALCKEEGYHPVRRSADLKENAVNALLTVEEGGAIEGDLQKLDVLYERGVRMMTLTWNYPNEIGFPNFPDFESLKEGKVPFTARETSRGLTEFGRETVERMNLLGMLADVSHGSDKLFYDVADICGRANIPFVASHSGADSVYACARNRERRRRGRAGAGQRFRRDPRKFLSEKSCLCARFTGRIQSGIRKSDYRKNRAEQFPARISRSMSMILIYKNAASDHAAFLYFFIVSDHRRSNARYSVLETRCVGFLCRPIPNFPVFLCNGDVRARRRRKTLPSRSRERRRRS